LVVRMFARAKRMTRNLGWVCAARYAGWQLVAQRPRRPVIRLHPRGIDHELVVRTETSDLDVFGSIFSGGEYAPIATEREVTFVIDAGANVGYSAAWFLSTFPSAVVCSIEPDRDNIALLRRNLAPYGDRAMVLHAALWSETTNLEVFGGYRDG